MASETEEPKEVNFKLRAAMDNKGITITDLANVTKLQRQSIYAILNNTSDPRICTLVRLAKALDVKVDELIQY
jgi:transcriptional regulator with XRE-family HTH domain